jgi:hypothetical protein
MNEYLYVSGGNPGEFIPGSLKDNRILMDDITLPAPVLKVNHATATAPVKAWRFPWGIIVSVRAAAVNTPSIVSIFTLLDARKQINIDNEVEKTSTIKKEGIYFAFPFALAHPHMKYQNATAWVDPTSDMLPGANLEWFATQGGVWGKGSVNSVGWATVDAPLITFENLNRGVWPRSIEISTGSVFSYVMNNYWYTDTPAQQGGQFRFRYALTSGPEVTETETMALTDEQRSPLVAIRHYNMGWEPTLPNTGAGFLNTFPASVKVLAISPLEGKNYLIRVENTAAQRVTADLRFPTVRLRKAWLGSVVGERIGPVDWTSNGVIVPMNHYEIKNVIVNTEIYPN